MSISRSPEPEVTEELPSDVAVPPQARRRPSPVLADQAELRRAALEAYGVLDGLPDAGFDALVSIAASVCQTPIAAVTLIDGERQWFKAEKGLGLTSIEIESSFCAHGFEAGDDVFVVPDTAADIRFANNRLVVQSPGVRWYAGAPLVTRDGVRLGAVCVLDHKPRTLTAAQQEALRALSRMAVDLLEARQTVAHVAVAAMEREEALRRAAASERSLKAVFDRASVGMMVLDLTGRILHANQALADMIGREVDELENEPSSVITYVDELPRERELMGQLVAGESTNVVREKHYRHADGSPVTAVSSTTAIRDSSGAVTAVLSHVESIEARRRAEESLLETQSAVDAIITADGSGTITAWNNGAERMFGHSRNQALAKPVSLIVPPDGRAAQKARIAQALSGAPGVVGKTMEVTGLRRDGSQFPFEISVSLWEHEGRPRLTGIIRDVTERHALHQQLIEQANTDALTGVGNRSWFVAELSAALQATPAVPLSVLVIELEGLHAIDESLGLLPGERILVDVAEHLDSVLRHGDRLARVHSGDFAVLLADTTPARAVAAAQRLRAAIPARFIVDGAPVPIKVCIGMATHRGAVRASSGPASATLLLRNATLALGAARKAPKRVATYASSMSQQARRRLSLHGALQEAIGRDEMSLVYQPQVDLTGGRLHGVEALARWSSPALGDISPRDFVPITEETGLAVEFGTWVLNQACAQARAWSLELAVPPSVSVNVSGHQLMDARVVTTLSEVLAATGLDPRLLTLEITESVLMRDPDAVTDRLVAIRALGVKTSVDDFGTGYSNLSSLTRFPLDEVKVDASFVSPLPANTAARHVARAIIDLAHDLGLRAIAEGIETKVQRDTLIALGAELGQGYLFAQPLSADAVATWDPHQAL